MDKYHEMMMIGSENHIIGMKERSKILRMKAQMCLERAEQLDGEICGLDKLRNDWAKALKVLEPSA